MWDQTSIDAWVDANLPSAFTTDLLALEAGHVEVVSVKYGRLFAQFDVEMTAHAQLIDAWAHHYGVAGPPVGSAAVAPTIDGDMREACAWSASGSPRLEERLPHRADELFARSFLRAYRTGWWQEYAAFHRAFADNRIRPYRQTAPLRIY